MVLGAYEGRIPLIPAASSTTSATVQDSQSWVAPDASEADDLTGWEFLKRALNERGFVEKVSGLYEVQKRAEELEREMADEGVDWGSEEEEGDGELV